MCLPCSNPFQIWVYDGICPSQQKVMIHENLQETPTKSKCQAYFSTVCIFLWGTPHKATVESSETNLTFRQWLVGAPRWWFHLETQYDREI